MFGGLSLSISNKFYYRICILPCSWRILTARIESRPPEKRTKAFFLLFMALDSESIKFNLFPGGDPALFFTKVKLLLGGFNARQVRQ